VLSVLFVVLVYRIIQKGPEVQAAAPVSAPITAV
jgi:hypothetical protein